MISFHGLKRAIKLGKTTGLSWGMRANVESRIKMEWQRKRTRGRCKNGSNRWIDLVDIGPPDFKLTITGSIN